jgi:transposase
LIILVPMVRLDVDASKAMRNPRATAASHRSKQAQDASSATTFDRGGNRQLNCALYRIAITQARVHPPARAYLERKQSEGKSRCEALRCLT